MPGRSIRDCWQRPSVLYSRRAPGTYGGSTATLIMKVARTSSSAMRKRTSSFSCSLLLLIVYLRHLASDNFFSVVTFTTILNQLPALAVVTVGMTLVLIVAGIDLSVGSVLGFSATVIGVAVVGIGICRCRSPAWRASSPDSFAVPSTVHLSPGSGLPAFIVTLGMLEMARGMAYIVNDSQTVYIGASIQKIALPLPGIGVSAALLDRVAGGRGRAVPAHEDGHGPAPRWRSAATSRRRVCQGIRRHDAIGFVVLAACRVRLPVVGGMFNAAYLGSADPNAGHRPRIVGDRRSRHRRHQPDGRPRIGARRVCRRPDHMPSCRTAWRRSAYPNRRSG